MASKLAEGEADTGASAALEPTPRRKSRSVPRFIRVLSPRVVLVFVSSPGDCAVERQIAHGVITRINADPLVARQRIQFRALLWEDLPPGLAERSDFQGRINALLGRYGYDDYGIYLGFFKGRLGTPTPRYASGTVEEFETSRSQRQRTGSPTELLVYFLDPEATLAPEVAQFRTDLIARGFLPTIVLTNAFEARLERNLLEIARAWTGWRNRVRRIGPKIVRAGAVAIVLLVLAAGGVNAWSYLQITADLASGDLPGAAARWRERALVMPLGYKAAQSAINAAIVRFIWSQADLDGRLAAMERWRNDPVFDPEHPAVQELRRGLASQTRAAVTEAAYRDGDRRAFALWDRGRVLALWPAADMAELLSTVAASRLIGALVASGIPPEQWTRKVLRSFECAAVERFARRVVGSVTEPDQWGSDRVRRVGIAVLAGDRAALMRLASDAAQRANSYEQPELAAWLALEPDAIVADWIGPTIKATTPPNIIGKLIDDVRRRGSPAVLAALVDRSLQADAPKDLVAQFDDLECRPPACSAVANAHLAAWAIDGAPMSPGIELLLQALDPVGLDAPTRNRIADRLAGLLNAGQSGPNEIQALSKLGTVTARKALDAYRDRSASRKISFDFRERAALIDDLAARVTGDGRARLQQARRLVLASEADAEDIHSLKEIPQGDASAPVDRAYLDLLAGLADVAGKDDRTILFRVAKRSSAATGAALGTDRRLALGRVLRALPESWTLDLLHFPPPPLLDPPWAPAWDERGFILAALREAGGRPMPAVARAALAGLPNDEKLAAKFAEAAAGLSVVDGRSYFEDRLAHGAENALEILARLGDRDRIRDYAREAARTAVATSKIPQSLAAAIEAMATASDREDLLEYLLNAWPGPIGALVPLATKDRIDDPKLRAAAAAELSRPESAAAVAAAVGYLGALDPAEPWRVVAQPSVAAPLASFLADADPSDWIVVAQALPFGDSSARVPTGAMALAVSRRIAVVLDWNDVSDEAAEAGVLLLPENRIVVNYLIAAATRHGEAAPALASASTLLQPGGSVTLVPSLSDGPSVFQSYLYWLAAAPLSVLGPGCIGRDMITADRLVDANPLVVRAAAAVALAAPRAVAKGVCEDASSAAVQVVETLPTGGSAVPTLP